MLLPGQLQQQALRQVPGTHARRVQTLDGGQGLVQQRAGHLHVLQSVQVLLGQISVLVHQLRQIPAQGQEGLGKPPPVQLVPEEGGKALRLPVQSAPLRGGCVLMDKGAAVEAAVDPAGLLAQFLVGAAQGRGILLFHQRIFLTDFAQVLQQLLGVHLQNLHGLEQLRRQLQLLPQLRFQRDQAHETPPLSAALTYLAIFRAAVAWEMPRSLATATVVPQRR